MSKALNKSHLEHIFILNAKSNNPDYRSIINSLYPQYSPIIRSQPLRHFGHMAQEEAALCNGDNGAIRYELNLLMTKEETELINSFPNHWL